MLHRCEIEQMSITDHLPARQGQSEKFKRARKNERLLLEPQIKVPTHDIRKLSHYGLRDPLEGIRREGVNKMPELREDNWISGQTIAKHGREAVVSNGGGEKEYTAKDEKFYKPWILVRFPDGAEFEFTLNRTTRDLCAKAWGTNTDAWVGKRIGFDVVKQKVAGDIKDVVYATPL